MSKDVSGMHLSMLGPKEAVSLVSDMVRHDATKSGISENKISFSSEINAPDDGIDGKVADSNKESDMGTIKKEQRIIR